LWGVGRGLCSCEDPAGVEVVERGLPVLTTLDVVRSLSPSTLSVSASCGKPGVGAEESDAVDVVEQSRVWVVVETS